MAGGDKIDKRRGELWGLGNFDGFGYTRLTMQLWRKLQLFLFGLLHLRDVLYVRFDYI